MFIPENISAAELLAALYNAASPQGMGWLHYDNNIMSVTEAQECLNKNKHNIDYLKGRPIKTDFTPLLPNGDRNVDAFLYDRDQHNGAFNNILLNLIKSKSLLI